MSTFEIRYRDIQDPAFELGGLRTGIRHQIILRPCRFQFLEFEDAFFRTKSSVLLPELQEAPADSSGPAEPPGTTGLVASCLRHCAANPGKKLLVAGHTDTSGSDEYNIPLSRNRAQAVYAAVVGDREKFKEACDGPHLTSKQEKSDVTMKDRLQILDWVSATFGWPCGFAQNANDYFRAVCAFQASYNESGHAGRVDGEDLAVDGDWGKKTWGAVYDCYEARLARRLNVELAGLAAYRAKLQFLDANTPFTGCGEYHPIENAAQDGYRSQTNRRVEVLFFDPGEEPTLECFGGGCAAKACELYDPKRYGRFPVPPGGGGDERPGSRVRLLDPFLDPIGSAPYRISVAGATQSGTADGDGWVFVAHDDDAEAEVEWGYPSQGGAAALVYRKATRLCHSYDSLPDDDAARLRLQHLGFWTNDKMKDSVLAYQRLYGLPQTGELADIRARLTEEHDRASPTHLPRAQEGEEV